MSSVDRNWLHRRGELARDGWESVVDHDARTWKHAGLRVARLANGERLELPAPGVERLIVPLAGSFDVVHTEGRATTVTALRGRASVFDGPTDVLYLSTEASATITGSGRFAMAASRTAAVHPTHRIAAADVPIELRGAGPSSRQVHNFGTPQTLEAARLIVCEVITPSGNWSSYPPHKHDEPVAGHETRLEEVYYFEAAPTTGCPAAPASAFGMFSAYSSSAGQIDINAMVSTGDIALVPFGFHGPAAAAPGYDLYYLNVMAGPDAERAWLATDDPAHAWVRQTWAEQTVDPRLPYVASTESENR